MRWKVTMELWRETWSGHDQCDDRCHIEIVESKTAKLATEKAIKKATSAGKGKRLSHSVWVRNAQAEQLRRKLS